MSQPILVVIIVLALAGAAYLFFLHRRTSTLSAKVAAMPNALGAALADLKSHISKEAEAVKQRTATVGTVIVDKLGGDKTTKPIPVVGTTAEPAPAAPAKPEAVAPPPVTVAPAAPPAVPAPSAEGSGTEHTLNVGVVEERVRNQYLSLDFTDKLPAAQVQLVDAEYIVKMGPAFRAALGTLPNVQLQFAILAGTQAAINMAMDHALQDIARTLKFDPATYTGPLKARYAALVEGVHSGAIKPVSLYSDTGTTS